MKKIIFWMLILLLAIFFNPFSFQKNIQPLIDRFSDQEAMVSLPIDESNLYDMVVTSNGPVLYNGQQVTGYDWKGKELFQAPLPIQSYQMKVLDERIYLLDKTNQMVYQMDQQGIIEFQFEVMHDPVGIYPLENGNLLYHYTSDVQVEGLVLYDEKGQVKKNNQYPNQHITIIIEDKDKGSFVVSIISDQQTNVFNQLFYYDKDGNNTVISQEMGSLFFMGEKHGSHLFLLDPKQLVIQDNDEEKTIKLNAEDYYQAMSLNENWIWLQDGSQQIRQYDLEGNFESDYYVEEPILTIDHWDDELIYATRDSITVKQTTRYFDQQILSMVTSPNYLLVKTNQQIYILESAYFEELEKKTES